MKRFAVVAAAASLAFVASVFVDVERANAQVVTSYYAPAPSVSYVPTRVGLFGWRVGYRPVVTYPSVVAAPTVVAPTTTYYRAPLAVPTVVSPPVTVYRPILPRRVYYTPRTVYYPPVYYPY